MSPQKKRWEPAPLNEDGYRYDDSDELLRKAREEGHSDHDRDDVKRSLQTGQPMPSGTVIQFYGTTTDVGVTGGEATGDDGNTGSTANTAGGGGGAGTRGGTRAAGGPGTATSQ